MISRDTPLDVRRGKCVCCYRNISQVLLESTIEGKYTRHWLKVDEVYGVGDEDEVLAGFHEHRCAQEAA